MTFRGTKNYIKKQNLHSVITEYCPCCGAVMSLEPDIKAGYRRICPQCGHNENVSRQNILQNYLL
jgi:DNA-directed RNA polymerase subunit M/transcription elongation factor TFIIS